MQPETAAGSVTVTAAVAAPTEAASSKPAPVDPSKLMAADGLVRRVDCSHKPEITVTLSGGNRPLIFHAADFGTVGVTGAGEDIASLDSCDNWKGRRIRIWFLMAKGKEYLGEITNLAFE